MQLVLFVMFFSDFFTPQKCIMSEGCWSFTLKMAVQNLGNRDFAFRWFQPKVDTDKKNTYHQYLGLENKIDKRKTTLVSQTFKVIKIKYLYFFHFWPLGQDIDDLCFLQAFTFGWNHLKVKSNLESLQFRSSVFSQGLSYIKFHLPLKIVFHWQSSPIKGCLPFTVIFHLRSSIIKACLTFNWRSSSIKGCLPLKVVFHWKSSSIEGSLPLKVVT